MLNPQFFNRTNLLEQNKASLYILNRNVEAAVCQVVHLWIFLSEAYVKVVCNNCQFQARRKLESSDRVNFS